jgi:tetratricopeptide (TPR) repeat protein
MACGRVASVLASLAAVSLAALLALRPAIADPIKADLTASDAGGYARLIFSLSDYDPADVRQSGNVLIISFRSPVDVSVDRLAAQVPDYIGGARRDPDGMAVRFALKRNVTVNAMTAGETYFVDLLPDTWHGLPPGLPQDVVEALARRARDAEKLAEHESRLVAMQKFPPVRLHVATQPTFTRYIFDVPEQVTVAAQRADKALTLTFDAPLRFDLGDAMATLPATVYAIEPQTQAQSGSLHFAFTAEVQVRTFRDHSGYVVDVVDPNAKPAQNSAILTLPPGTLPPPASAPPAANPAQPVQPAAPDQQSATKPPAAAAAAEPAKPAVAAPPPPAKPAAQLAPQQPNRQSSAPQRNDQAKQQPAVPQQAIAQAAAPAPAPPANSSLAPAPAPPADTHLQAPAANIAPLAAAPAAIPPAAPAAPPAAAAAPAPKPAAAAPPAAAGNPANAAAAPVAAPPRSVEANGKVPVELARQGTNLKISFDFLAPTAAAMFQRADTLWIVFDTKADIDLGALRDEASRTLRSAELTRAPDADIVRIKLDRPRLAGVAADGPAWSVEIGDTVADPTHAVDLSRNLVGPNRASVSIALDGGHALHRITDPEAGDQLIVVTAFAPARGLIHAQDFIEFRALSSEHGVAIEPLADDLTVALSTDKVVIGRPAGLTLSSTLQALLQGNALQPQTFDAQVWGFDRQASYEARQSRLIADAAAAPANKRTQPRLELARFYIARDMYPEAKGVLDVVLGDKRPASADVSAIVLRAIAEIMMGRPQAALKDLADPAVGDQHDAPLWRALAYAREGRWGEARAGFKASEAAIATLPVELQRIALKDEMRAAIEVGDYGDAENALNDLQTIGIPKDMQPAVAVLIGRLDEGIGRTEDALAAYRTAAESRDRPAAAQGRLRETELRYSLGDLKRDDVVSDLESLTTIWRGDETEIEALKVLADLYTAEGRYRDSFYVMRSAMTAHPDWDMTRKIQEEAAKTFDSLFLAGKGDSLSAIDSLSLFYDFRELTPIGSRGDEMIRRLGDRLVSVDLLDQAADLLQYQVDKRLQGAARAEVATRLAVIYLMNRKPDRALAALRTTRVADLSGELRDERLLLEARALSDLGRHELALDVASDVKGPVAIRLRSDIYWASRKWGQGAEQIELLYGERWKQWQPLTDVERSDILRAEIGYALAEDKLGLERFRDKYAAKMAGTPDARAFEVVSAPLGTGGTDFRNIAHVAAAADTLDDFLRDMKARYPESNPISAGPLAEAPAPPAAAAPAAAQPKAAAPVAAPPVPRTDVPGRTALR